jgi:hypothetical protein
MAWETFGNSITDPTTQFLGTTNPQPLAIKTNNAERMRLSPAGELLIGTTTAMTGARLRVAGAGATINNIAIGTDVTGIDYPEQDRTIGVTSTTSTLRLQSPNAIALHTGSSGTTPEANQRLTITAAGDVGVGTTTPAHKLDVAGPINATDVRRNGTPLVSSQWADVAGGISYSQANVGIGALNPSYKLNVDGAMNATSVNAASINAGTIDAAEVRKSGTSLVSSQWTDEAAESISYGGNVGIGAVNASYKLNVDGVINATDVRTNGSSLVSSQWVGAAGSISYGGNVGIGAPSTGAKLSVSGGGATINSIAIGTDVAGVPGINYPNEAETIGVASTTATLRLHSPNGLTFHTGSTGPTPEANQRLTITATGNVGIGAATPRAASYKLDVAGILNADEVYMNGAPLVSSQWSNVAGGISYAAGNVGIGTAALNHKLCVADTIYSEKLLAPEYATNINPTPANSKLLLYDFGGGNWAGIGVDTAGYIWLRAGWDQARQRLVRFSGSGLSVQGDTTIGAGGKLDVSGSINAGNSDIYFTQPSHNHTGIGNTPGFAAIENAANYGALMILGRAGTARGRTVKLWDYLQVNGTMDVTSNLNVAGAATKPGGGWWSASSDARLKKNVTLLKGALGKLLQLRGVSFEWKKPEEQGNLRGPQMGLIAQEVEEVLPEWVDTDPMGYKTLTVRGFEALTVEAFRELKAELEDLRATLRKG